MSGYNGPNSPDEVTHFMMGNLCRCTGYLGIIRAIDAAAAAGAPER